MNIQTENGYLKIANDLQKAFCAFRIPGEARMIVDCIILKTYGFNKKEDRISNSQIVEMTGLKKANVSRMLAKLITHKIVSKNANKLRLNKNPDEWISFKRLAKTLTDKKLAKRLTPVSEKANNLLAKRLVTKDNKDNIQKTVGVASEITKYIEAFNGLFGTKYQETKDRRVKLYQRRKRYSLEQIFIAMTNLSQSKFHRGNNDRNWQATPDFLIRSDEKIDEWLNKPPPTNTDNFALSEGYREMN